MKIAEQEAAITDLREERHGLRQFVDARPSIYTEAIGNAMANSNSEADRLRNRIIELEARQQGTSHAPWIRGRRARTMPTSRITLSVTCRWHCRATPRHATRTPRHTTSSAAPCTVLDRAADHKIHEIVREEALASMEAMEAKQAAETRLKEESAAFPEFAASRCVSSNSTSGPEAGRPATASDA